MRPASPTTRPNTMRQEPSGVDDPATREARAWLRRQLAWEHRLAQLRASAEVAPVASTSTTDRGPHAGVRQ
jgi:hypothetical protein